MKRTKKTKEFDFGVGGGGGGGGGEEDCGLIQKDGLYTSRIRFKGKIGLKKIKSQKAFYTISNPYENTLLRMNQTTSTQNPNQPSNSQSQSYREENIKYLKDIFQPDKSLRDEPKGDTELQEELSSADSKVEPSVIKEEAVEGGTEKGFEGDTYKRYFSHFKYVPKLRELQSQIKLPIEEQQFKVIGKEFKQEIGDRCPEIKIHKGSSTIILEGPDQKIKLGVTTHDETVKERRVMLSTPLLNFIKAGNAISRYRTVFEKRLKHPVSVEVGTELVLSSMSLEALDEAEAILQRDLSLVNVPLPEAKAVPLDLDRVKETMIKATNEANSQELRVNTGFIPGPKGGPVTKVRLVGYSENVNKLKETLHCCLMNQEQTQEVLNLPHDLVDSFDAFLKVIGPKHTKVTFKASHVPNPHVLLTGPPAMVQEVLESLNATLATLTLDTLVFDGPGAHWYFKTEGKLSMEIVQSSCQVVIEEQQEVGSLNVKINNGSQDLPKAAISERQLNTIRSTEVNKASLGIKIGNLEDEQADVLVVPMVRCQLTSTNIGKSLLRRAGNYLKFMFDIMAAKFTLIPGDVLQVDAPPSLCCSKLFFIECLPWDGVRGQSVQALDKGLLTCLNLCKEQRLRSVAFPVIGSGLVLKYTIKDAVQMLADKICQFASSTSSKFPSDIHIVIKPGYNNSEECYYKVCDSLSSKVNNQGQSIFRSLTTDLDSVTMTTGGEVKLRLIFGDITNETTDAVVNTTDFKNFKNDGVCKDILAIAGPEVEEELRAASGFVKRGDVYESQPGSFPCSVLLHACGENDAGIIEQVVVRIIEHCEKLQVSSVAIPALCTGAGRMDVTVVAHAILRGVKAATSSTSLNFLREIHLVLFKINAFLAFKQEAMQMFPTATKNTGSVPQLPHMQQESHSSVSEEISKLVTACASQKSSFLILGLSRKYVDDAVTKLRSLYEAQCSTQTFKMEELANLSPEDMEDLKLLVGTQGLCIQENQGTLTVRGLKDGVNQVMQLVNASLNRKLRVREEDDLYIRVAWCILAQNGNWERLPKKANYYLEKKDAAHGIVDAQGLTWNVDLQRMEAILQMKSGQRAKLKRLANLQDFTFPLCWDNMTNGEKMEMFALEPLSPEYQTVEKAFKQTVSQAVLKIERVQNVHLRHAYEVQKKRIADKNRQEGGVGEKLLYHGTTQTNCKLIMENGFNRRYAGQNAASFGHGTYFAVNASYSAKPTYSKPTADGTQMMLVARVLTGIYTLGQRDMKVPPHRSGGQSHDTYDSVVDAIINPSMYVVFHDNQAYPEYLITFK